MYIDLQSWPQQAVQAEGSEGQKGVRQIRVGRCRRMLETCSVPRAVSVGAGGALLPARAGGAGAVQPAEEALGTPRGGLLSSVKAVFGL